MKIVKSPGTAPKAAAPAAKNRLLGAALYYAKLGYLVFPCDPTDKTPRTKNGFKDATSDRKRIREWWARWPDAAVGIATAGLLVVDRDGPDNPWPGPELESTLAAAPCAKTPRGGMHWYFRPVDGSSYRCTQGSLAQHVDTRADGGYIIAPPSRITHVGAYRWLDGRRLGVPPGQLPVAPDWLVQQLQPPAPRQDGRPIPSDVEPTVIPEGRRNSTLARFAGGMRRQGMTAPEMAAALQVVNQERCRPPLDPAEVDRIAESVAQYEPDAVSVRTIHRAGTGPNSDDADDESAAVVPGQPPQDPGPMPESLLYVPGFVDRVVEYTLSTAPYPDRVLAFAGALSLMAVLAGRKVRDEMDSRTNLYVLALANSGAGKDHPRKVNQRILTDAGAPLRLGNSFASGEGIEDRLFDEPASLFQVDELDGLLRRVGQARDARHEQILSILLSMFSSASTSYVMRARAGRKSAVINQPCLCLFGTAVPSQFYHSITTSMLASGFLARMVILTSGRRTRGQDAAVTSIPREIVAQARWWIDYDPDDESRTARSTTDDPDADDPDADDPDADDPDSGEWAARRPIWHPQLVRTLPAANQLFAEFRGEAEQEYAQAEARDDQAAMSIWARAHEKARRLALIYACSDPRQFEPLIGEPAADWSCRFAAHQTRQMLAMAAVHTAENLFDGRRRQVLDALARWATKEGNRGMPAWRLHRQFTWTSRELDEVLQTLLGQRLIERVEQPTPGRTAVLYRLAGR